LIGKVPLGSGILLVDIIHSQDYCGDAEIADLVSILSMNRNLGFTLTLATMDYEFLIFSKKKVMFFSLW